MSIGLPCSSRVTRVRLRILAFFTLISSTCSDGVPFCTHAPNRSEGEGPSRSLCPRVPSTNVCVPAPTHRSSRGFHHPRAQTPAYGHFDNSIYEHVGERVSVRRCTPGGPHGFVFSTLIVPVAYRSSIERIRRFFRLFSGRPLLPLLAAGFNAQPVRLFDVHIRATVYTTLRVFFSSWVCL